MGYKNDEKLFRRYEKFYTTKMRNANQKCVIIKGMQLRSSLFELVSQNTEVSYKHAIRAVLEVLHK